MSMASWAFCRLHFRGLVQFGGAEELAYTWDHYVAFPDLPDRDGRMFTNKVERVTRELWVSLPHITLLIILNHWIFLKMTEYVVSIYMTSLDALRDMRPRQLKWLTKPVTSS